MGKITIYLPNIDDILCRYTEDDETVENVTVVENLPTAKEVLRNHLILLMTQLNDKKLKDIT